MGLKQLEPTVEKVGDYDFYITPFPAFKAANLTGELASVLAPLLGALAPLINDTTNSEDKGLGDIDAGQAAAAIGNCSGISGDKLELLMRKLLVGGNIVVEIENEEGEIEPHKLDMDTANEIFCGNVQDMFVLCFHVIKLNFNGFFKRFAALSGAAGSAGKKPNKK